ncbi:PB1 domain-containing protein [Exophiala viscosa]|uniref:PB1 domain-containing protein n=1 Tax=Exophiala viscosa TaxID=2486360 RepID=A0AAN6DXB6_9EURO|nr:PB1 domain-containing protein [Exophiala viscosa]
MSLKQEIETWVEALGHYDNQEFEEALTIFDAIADTSKILFNCGVIHATIGEHERAVECYQRAIKLDQYLAVAYFQQGVSNFLVGDFEEALANFNDTLLYLRGNTYIDYEQLGLKFKLYSCEVLFNRGLCYMYLQQEDAGLQDFTFAQKEKMTPDHDVIDDAIKERAQGYVVFSIPVGCVYRPNEAKVKNLKAKDYLGKARLIATSNSQNTGTGFEGAERRQAIAIEMAPRDDRPPENISYAATNLVQRNLSSRLPRDQSAPPVMNRNVFPPTPPPEAEKPRVNSGGSPAAMPVRSASMRNPRAMFPGPDMTQRQPRPGMLPRAATIDDNGIQQAQIQSRSRMQQGPPPTMEHVWTEDPMMMDRQPQMERSRYGTQRTASEPRGPAPRRQMLDRSGSQRAPAPLFRETTQPRYEEPIDQVDDVYQMYASPRTRRHQRQEPETYFNEEDEYIDEEVNSEDMNGFEPIRREPSRSGRGSKRPEMRKVRVKCHFNEDTRYLMIGAVIDFGDFESKIREKFGIKNRLKIRMQDDGDMITMGDQDDLEMLLSTVRNQARKERSEMGKMEVWISSQ